MLAQLATPAVALSAPLNRPAWRLGKPKRAPCAEQIAHVVRANRGTLRLLPLLVQ
jgi:hypothetical protein